ncbi:hypothetical protein AVT46_gp64 [Mycobacterium phage MOOREtheMARYer]|uniref:Uncharacterized protein n=1 Tax=Mycobacterium phage MOOREtheMARYer TaxID=1647309 RepID=A0A0F6WEU5_9CAUD|nr:hypothetical protein AVT46_gp64 [Mycobacterium phage MOOREtheMARYer]AKF14925.1 hypothetical protein SEA_MOORETHEMARYER_64 [Mycobacterium phage MOOREtheMARYer]
MNRCSCIVIHRTDPDQAEQQPQPYPTGTDGVLPPCPDWLRAVDRSGRDAYLEGVPDVAEHLDDNQVAPLRVFRPRPASNSRRR